MAAGRTGGGDPPRWASAGSDEEETGATVKPRFNSIDLVDDAAAEVLGTPASRTTRERLPDVAGEFFQVSPPGGREAVVRGVLASAVQASTALAAADLKAKIRARQAQVGQAGTYWGTDAHEYAASCLLAFRQLGPIQITSAGGGVQAMGRVEARILTQP